MYIWLCFFNKCFFVTKCSVMPFLILLMNLFAISNGQKKLEAILLCKGRSESAGEIDDANLDSSIIKISEVIKEKATNLEVQELLSVEAANSLLLNLKSQIEPLGICSSQTSQWEEKSAAVRLANKIQKYDRNKRWRKKKRKRVAEKLTKERERFDQADQEADEWRAREIAKDIARRKVENMKEIAKVKANEERKKLESELEMVLIVEKLQELRSIRIQKLKKQGNFSSRLLYCYSDDEKSNLNIIDSFLFISYDKFFEHSVALFERTDH
ncbi:hypothetical protein C5167_047818 [Papaver somniferum]|uniref:Uncharacterized protein n=1 Tax=Papaver somniferum TaxID=3469 RepID=A0A4Y7LHR5_PAPSO|nr:hypothetical protein C5167_047818 [Papaver somniferum]